MKPEGKQALWRFIVNVLTAAVTALAAVFGTGAVQ